MVMTSEDPEFRSCRWLLNDMGAKLYHVCLPLGFIDVFPEVMDALDRKLSSWMTGRPHLCKVYDTRPGRYYEVEWARGVLRHLINLYNQKVLSSEYQARARAALASGRPFPWTPYLLFFVAREHNWPSVPQDLVDYLPRVD